MAKLRKDYFLESVANRARSEYPDRVGYHSAQPNQLILDDNYRLTTDLTHFDRLIKEGSLKIRIDTNEGSVSKLEGALKEVIALGGGNSSLASVVVSKNVSIEHGVLILNLGLDRSVFARNKNSTSSARTLAVHAVYLDAVRPTLKAIDKLRGY